MDSYDVTPDQAPDRPQVLFVYFSYTGQTEKALRAMATPLENRGCDVTFAKIGFTDPRYAERFAEFPMPRPFIEVVGMIPAELRRKPGLIEIPDSVTAKKYDLVVVGSPTWWLSTNVPVRSFLQSDTARTVLTGTPFVGLVLCRRYWKHNLKTVRRIGTQQGGKFLDGLHFRYAGGQIRSLLSLLSYLGAGENRPKYLGVKIPPTNLRDEQLIEAATFAEGLADKIGQAA